MNEPQRPDISALLPDEETAMAMRSAFAAEVPSMRMPMPLLFVTMLRSAADGPPIVLSFGS